MANIILIRPGCTDFDEQHRVQGSLDLPLNSKGEREVQNLIDELRQADLDVIYSGPCEPARSTAEEIASELDLPLHETELLKNLHQGLWEGLELEELERKFPKVVKQWHESPERICPPQGEPVSEGIERIQRALRKPLRKGVSFGIVASEPFASLISLLIRGEKPSSQPICGCENQQRVEFLRRNGEAVASKGATLQPGGHRS